MAFFVIFGLGLSAPSPVSAAVLQLNFNLEDNVNSSVTATGAFQWDTDTGYVAGTETASGVNIGNYLGYTGALNFVGAYSGSTLTSFVSPAGACAANRECGLNINWSGDLDNAVSWTVATALSGSLPTGVFDYFGGPQYTIPMHLTSFTATNLTAANVTTIPLPPSAILFGTALLGLAGLRRRKRKAA